MKSPYTFSKLADELIGDLRGVTDATPARQVKRATRPLAELVEELMVKHHVGRPSTEQTIRDHWVELVGAPNAQYSNPVRIEGKALHVAVSHAVVKNEIFHHRAEIVERLKLLPGCGDLKILKLRTG